MSNDSGLNFSEVRHMAKLSGLVVSSGEEELFAGQLSRILGYMDVLQSVDTSKIDPLYTPLQQSEYQREDIAENFRSREEMLANAPETDGQYFIVPRIV